MKNWRAEFDFDGGIQAVWSARFSFEDGKRYSIENLGHNADILPGECLVIGLEGTFGAEQVLPENVSLVEQGKIFENCKLVQEKYNRVTFELL